MKISIMCMHSTGNIYDTKYTRNENQVEYINSPFSYSKKKINGFSIIELPIILFTLAYYSELFMLGRIWLQQSLYIIPSSIIHTLPNDYKQ